MPSENSIRGLPQIYPRGPDEYRRLRSIRWPSNEHGRFSKHKTTFAGSLFAYSTTQNNLYKSSEWAKTRQQPVARQLLLLLSQMLQFTGIISRPLSSSWYVDDSILQLDRNLIGASQAVNSMYFAQVTLLVGGGAFARAIAAVVGGETLTSWPAAVSTMFVVALAPPISQAADFWGRKWFIVVTGVSGFVGCILISRATTFNMAIAGFCLGGVSGGTSPLMHAVTSEVLPRKYRSWAQAIVNGTIALGCIFALLLGGALTSPNPAGFRTFFYACAGVFAFAAIAPAVLYNPPPRELQLRLTFGEKIRALDWMAYFLVTSGMVLVCLGLSWAQNPYPWTNAHVLAPFLIGCGLLFALVIYSWKFKRDGLLHHDLFHDRNFPISLWCIFFEGAAFMGANVFVPYSLSVLYAGVMSPFRQALCYNVVFCGLIVACAVSGFYIYKTKTVRLTSMAGFFCFMLFYILMATVNATTSQAHYWGYIPFAGLGLGSVLITLVTAAQFSTPPVLIAITSGLLLTVRSFGATIGLAIFNAIFAHGLTSNLVPKVAAAVIPLGLTKENIPTLLGGLTSGNMTVVEGVLGITPQIIGAAGLAMKQAYVVGFRDVFITAAVFSFVALVCKFKCLSTRLVDSSTDSDSAAAFLRNPNSEFNSKIDAPIDGVPETVEEESREKPGAIPVEHRMSN
jgi:MFS family permease